MQQGLLHTLPFNKGRDHCSGVVYAVSDHRPAIVFSRLYQVNLIPTARAVFMGDQQALNVVVDQPLNISVPVTVDFW